MELAIALAILSKGGAELFSILNFLGSLRESCGKKFLNPIYPAIRDDRKYIQRPGETFRSLPILPECNGQSKSNLSQCAVEALHCNIELFAVAALPRH